MSDFPILDLEDIDNAFVKDEYREGQKECIQFAINAFNSGKQIVILECPTGSGKSTIGMTIANMVQDSFYITITKILQDQLSGDFDDIVNLKGKNAYPCTFYKREGNRLVNNRAMTEKDLADKLKKRSDCSSGYCRTTRQKCDMCFLSTPPSMPYYKAQQLRIQKGSLKELPSGMKYSACPYYEQVYEAVNSRKVVMNFSSFIFQSNYTQRFLQRDLLIIDEGHNIEPQLLDFVTFSINDSTLQNYNISLKEFKTAAEYLNWFRKIDFVAKMTELQEKQEAFGNLKEADEITDVISKYKLFEQNLENSDAEWVVEFNEKYEKGKNINVLTLKPVFAIEFVHSLLFKYGKRILIMSATILDVGVMCKSLGIDKSTVASYRMKNRFPVKNRPIYFKPVDRMTGGKDKMAIWMPKMVKAIDEIAEKYEGQRGIIHTHNFAILEYLVKNCKFSVASRFTTQKEFSDKKVMLDYHNKTSDSIIVAPAMHEGIDLKDDLSRFQIICKIPFANFYDNKQLKRRVEIDQKYYNWLTALKLVQSYGRSIRSETDYADTYIIDEALNMFLSNSRSMMPSWFLEAIIKC